MRADAHGDPEMLRRLGEASVDVTCRLGAASHAADEERRLEPAAEDADRQIDVVEIDSEVIPEGSSSRSLPFSFSKRHGVLIRYDRLHPPCRH